VKHLATLPLLCGRALFTSPAPGEDDAESGGSGWHAPALCQSDATLTRAARGLSRSGRGEDPLFTSPAPGEVDAEGGG